MSRINKLISITILVLFVLACNFVTQPIKDVQNVAGTAQSIASALPIETIQALVRAGLGISLIPAMAAQPEREDAPEYRSLAAPRPERRIVAVWPKQRPLSRAAGELMKKLPQPARKQRR